MKLNTSIVWILRISLGLLFIYSGGRKLIDPVEFSDAIAGFRSLPSILIPPVALGLPVFEIVLGVMMLLPNKYLSRFAAFALVLLNVGFILLLSVAWARGLTVECGCFGLGIFPPSQWTLQIAIVRDLIFLAMACVVYVKIDQNHFSPRNVKGEFS